MNNTYLYTRMLAEDVQAAELQIEYNKTKREQIRGIATSIEDKITNCFFMVISFA